MLHGQRLFGVVAMIVPLALIFVLRGQAGPPDASAVDPNVPQAQGAVTVRHAAARDESPPLVALREDATEFGIYWHDDAEAAPQVSAPQPNRAVDASVPTAPLAPERSVLVASLQEAAAAGQSRPVGMFTLASYAAPSQPTGQEGANVDGAADEAAAARRAAMAAVEQTEHGTKPPPDIVASFDGLGVGFDGPQGRFRGGNPSDNSLAVGPNHVIVTVNSRMAIFTKKGEKYDTTGEVLYGPVNTNNVFRDCGNCGNVNNGDAVVRYDQLADRWLIVMPIFRRLPPREIEPEAPSSGGPAERSMIGREGQPGPAAELFQPPPEPVAEGDAARGRGRGRGARGQRGRGFGRGRGRGQGPQGSYAMCYAISTTSDPLGSYYRYEFVRPLFPDYPRPAVWPDGYYVPTSTSDNIIQKHACVVDRAKMLAGEDASEQCFVIDGVNFLNNADVDGQQLPPPGAPNIMMATGGAQLNDVREDDGVYTWKIHVDWDDPAKTKLDGPTKIDVAPYEYLCGGQLTRCVPQPGTETRLDAQGDKIMARLVYRRIGDQESIVGVHSVNTTAGGGGVRWYEFRLDADRNVKLHQQGTYAPEGFYRWMASPAIDKLGNIGIGYSFGGTPHYAGQRFAGRQPDDPLGVLTLREAVLIEGQAAQSPDNPRGNRWQDYTQTAVDPSDDCTIWYVGDYVKEGETGYSSRVGAFRMPGCGAGE